MIHGQSNARRGSQSVSACEVWAEQRSLGYEEVIQMKSRFRSPNHRRFPSGTSRTPPDTDSAQLRPQQEVSVRPIKYGVGVSGMETDLGA